LPTLAELPQEALAVPPIPPGQGGPSPIVPSQALLTAAEVASDNYNYRC